MRFFHQHSFSAAVASILISANLRHLSLAVEVPLTPAPQCERHGEGCNIDEHLPTTREDDLRGLELLQMELRLQSNSVQSPSSQVTGHELKPNVHVATAATFDDGFHSPLLSALQVSTQVKPMYSTGHRHRYLTDFLMTMQRLTLSGSTTSYAMGTVPLLILLSCVLGSLLIACMVGMMKRTKNDRSPRQTDAMTTPFPTRGGDSSRAVDSRLPGQIPAAQASLPAQQFDYFPSNPICPQLILPHTEARFTISIESLMKAMKVSASVDILGTSGRKLLHGSVDEEKDTGRRRLTIASNGSENDPRVTVLARTRSQPESTSTGPLEIYGKNMEFYGTLELDSDGGAVLRSQSVGKPVMTLKMEDPTEMKVVAWSVDSEKRVATAGKNVQVYSNRRVESHDQWKMQVSPNSDAVLIAACMLSYIILLMEE